MPRISFLIFCLIFFMVSFGVAAMSALIPAIALHFGVTKECALKLTWLYMLPYGLVALIWAPLTRLIKIKKLLLFSACGFFFSAFLFSSAYTIKEAFVFRFLMGCFACSFVPLTLISVAKTVEAKDKAKYIGIFFGISYLATFLSVFLSGFLYWRIIYLVPAFLSLAVFILIRRHLEEFDFRRSEFHISYIETLRDRRALKFFLVIMLGSFIYHSLQQRLGVYLSETYSLAQVAISMIFTIAMFAAIIFEFSGGFLSSRFGNVKITRIGFILMGFFSLALVFSSRQAFPFLIILWGAGWALTHVGLSAHLAHFPDKILRDASSLNSAIRFSFGGLGAAAAGALVSAAGFNALFMIVGLGLLILGFSLNKFLR